MYPFAEQILAYKPNNEGKKIDALVLEVKGDFCHEILARHDRHVDYIEIGIDSESRHNPLQNDLDASALTHSTSSLLNNLCGKGKEPFWQQAYTNLVKLIILLHKVGYDSVTLFDVYESAISPDVLERKIQDAERRLEERHFLLASANDFRTHFNSLELLDCLGRSGPDVPRQRHAGPMRYLEANYVDFEMSERSGLLKTDPDAGSNSKRSSDGFNNDWRCIDQCSVLLVFRRRRREKTKEQSTVEAL